MEYPTKTKYVIFNNLSMQCKIKKICFIVRVKINKGHLSCISVPIVYVFDLSIGLFKSLSFKRLNYCFPQVPS